MVVRRYLDGCRFNSQWAKKKLTTRCSARSSLAPSYTPNTLKRDKVQSILFRRRYSRKPDQTQYRLSEYFLLLYYADRVQNPFIRLSSSSRHRLVRAPLFHIAKRSFCLRTIVFSRARTWHGSPCPLIAGVGRCACASFNGDALSVPSLWCLCIIKMRLPSDLQNLFWGKTEWRGIGHIGKWEGWVEAENRTKRGRVK